MRASRMVAAGFLGALVSGWALAQPPFYRITRVGSLGGSATYGRAMNYSGQVTGEARTTNNAETHAFLWNGTTMRDLGTLGGTYSSGIDINGFGQVTGAANMLGNKSQHAFLWNGTTTRDLGTLGGSDSVGISMNNSGQVTGAARTTNDVTHAFLWDGTTMRDLTPGPGGFESSSNAIAINSSGQVVGGTPRVGGDHAFVWDSTNGIIDLGTLGGTDSWGSDINNSGQVAGDARTTGDAAIHAFLWTGTTMRDLGTLGGTGLYDQSFGNYINAVGQVIGDSWTASEEWHSFFWDGTAMRDLGTLGGSVTVAHAVSTAGQVTGYSQCYPSLSCTPVGGPTGAFLWDGIAMYELMNLIDPADPLRSRVGLEEGIGINNRGQILVRGWIDTPDNDNRDYVQTFVLTPVLRYDLKSFTLNKPEVAGCLNVTGQVTLSRAAPAGGVVITVKDNLDAASTPLTVKILEGLTSTSFTVKTIPVTTAQRGVVAVILGGSAMTKDLKVRPMGMSAVILTPNSVVGGKSVVSTAKLECKAGPGPITVNLASSNTAVAKPSTSSVVVAVGVQSAPFTVRTSIVTASKTVTIKGTANGIAKSKVLTVSP